MPCPRTLFVSPQSSSCPLSKNAISFFLREVISQASSSASLPGPSSVATSVSFLGNYCVQGILESACWKSASVFTSFYLSNVQFSFDRSFGLGPFVVASTVVS